MFKKKPAFNSGVLPDPRPQEEKEKDFMAGAETAVPTDIRVPSGDWSNYYPVGEPQSKVVKGKLIYDTSACTHFAPGKELEAQLIYLYKNNLLPEAQKSFLKQFMTVSGDANTIQISKRYAAIVGGNTKNGNYFQKAWESYRVDGFIPHTMLPDVMACNSWEEFHSPAVITPEMRQIAKQSLTLFKVMYETLFYDKVPGISPAEEAHWNEYLKLSPLNVRIPGHSTSAFKVKNSRWNRFEHYVPYVRENEKSTLVEFAMRGYITPIEPEKPPVKPAYTFTKLPVFGERSESVRMLQEVLIYYGFLKSGLNTGYFGTITQKALDNYLLGQLNK
jgi:hypothetical protein